MAWTLNPFKNISVDKEETPFTSRNKGKHTGIGGDVPIWGLNDTYNGNAKEFVLPKSAGAAFKKYIDVTQQGDSIRFGLQQTTLTHDINKMVSDPLIEQYGMADAKYCMTAQDKGKTGQDIHYPRHHIWQAIALHRMIVLEQSLHIRSAGIQMNKPHIINLKDRKENQEQAVLDLLNTSLIEYITNLDLIIDSEVFKWSDKTLNLAMDMDVPEHDLTGDLMPVESMFMVFEKPIYFSDAYQTKSDRRFASWINLRLMRDEQTDEPWRIQWTIDNKNLHNYRQLVTEGKNHEGRHVNGECEAHSDDTYSHGWIALGGKYPKDIHDPEQFEGDSKSMETVRFINDMVIKMLTFVNTTVSRVESESVDRATRKRAKKGGYSYPNVNVVNLRAYESNGSSYSNGNGEGRYTRGHKVRGFYKSQHHGINNSLTKTIYIDPFYRGDLENMVEEKVYNVSR